MSSLLFQPAHLLRQSLINREVSAQELVQVFSQQISATNDKLNALVTLNLGAAYDQAQQLDLHLAKHRQPVGLLHGLPLAVKDVFNTQGIRTTFGNPNFAQHIPTSDDIVVSRERLAGAIIMGKSNTPDCASGGITTNSIFGLTHNPWDAAKTTSGSGGGGISALMGGMVALANGSDIGGSVRSPACWSHCVGFRPTSGRIPGQPAQAADGDTSTAGIFARCVTDAALYTQAVQGPSNLSAVAYPCGPDINWLDLQLPEILPIAWQPDFAAMDVHPQIAKSFTEQADVIIDSGMQLSHEALNLDQEYRQLFEDFNAWRFFACLPDVVAEDALAGKSKASHNHYAQWLRNTSALDIHKMLLHREQLRVRLQDYFTRHSAIATPVHAGLAFGVADEIGLNATDWAPLYLAPLLGLPSIVVPCGFTSDGMPNGIMFTGPAGSDQQLLQIARAFEQSRALPIGQPDLSWCTNDN